jgi:glycyl-tRNA synthetase beta subunit
MSHDLKAIVAGNNKAVFSHYRDGNFFYVVKVQDQKYSVPIPIEDVKGTTFFAEFKAITLMRWIRKAIENKTFQPVK